MNAIQRLMRRVFPRKKAVPDSVPDSAIEGLVSLDPGDYSCENYPSAAICACLDSCQALAARLPATPACLRLRDDLAQAAQDHAALSEEVTALGQSGAALRQEILALAAAARPLREPGLEVGGRRREALREKADELRPRRDAYEAQQAALNGRIEELVLRVRTLHQALIELVQAP